MLKRDFIEKQLEQLGLVIARLLGDMVRLKEQGKQEEALNLAKENLRSEFDLDLNEILLLEEGNAIDLLSTNKKFRTGHLSLLADLLYEIASINESIKQTSKAKQLYKRTERLYEYINEKEKTFSEIREQRINILKSKQNEL